MVQGHPQLFPHWVGLGYISEGGSAYIQYRWHLSEAIERIVSWSRSPADRLLTFPNHGSCGWFPPTLEWSLNNIRRYCLDHLFRLLRYVSRFCGLKFADLKVRCFGERNFPVWDKMFFYNMDKLYSHEPKLSSPPEYGVYTESRFTLPFIFVLANTSPAQRCEVTIGLIIEAENLA